MNNFNKLTVILLIFTALLTLMCFSSNCALTTETSEYVKIVSNFCNMNPEEIYNKIENEEKFVLFLGSETCYPCTQFVPMLNEAAQEVNALIFYLDCRGAMPGGNVYDLFEKYNVSFIPTLLIFDGENYIHPRTPEDKETLKRLLGRI